MSLRYLAILPGLAVAAGFLPACRDEFPRGQFRIESTTVLSADVAPAIDPARTYEYDFSHGPNDSLLMALWLDGLPVMQAWYPVAYMCEDMRGGRLTVELSEADDTGMLARDFRPGTGRLFCSEYQTRYTIGEPPADGFWVDLTVEFLDLEGGCWSLRQSDGLRYEPLELADEFRHDGLAVRATLRIRTGMGSVCMIGPIVEVLAIERR